MKFSQDAFRKAMKAWGHTHQEAAFRMRVSIGAVDAWAAGRRIPKGLYLDRVTDYILGSTKRKSSD